MRRPGVYIALIALLALPGGAAAASEKVGKPSLPPPLPGPRELQALDGFSHALIELDRRRGASGIPLLRRAGGELVSRRLRIWRLPTPAARGLIPRLVRAGLLRAVQPDRPFERLNHLAAGDPLVPSQWWLAAVGADRAEPPGPGVPVTVLDSGLDVGHQEFAGRANTNVLNGQDLSTPGDEHGTAVSSVAAAPANALGVVGVYPQAVLNVWDAGDLSTGAVIAGIEAAVDRGPSVINMSWGGQGSEPMLEEEVLLAFGSGSLLVAAAGNEFEEGNPIEYPASYSHVLTVAATDQALNPSYFSNANLAVDLAAPGEGIPVAVPVAVDPSGYSTTGGTSFAAPIVAGATAWVWTARPNLDHTQVFDLIRYAAKDVGAQGYDEDTGFGLLDIPTALADEPPASDHQEPNDDVDHVKANGLFAKATRPLTDPGRRRAAITARLDITEDSEDVYRVWVPGKREVLIEVAGDRNVDVELWDPSTPSVFVKGKRRRQHLIDASYRIGRKTDTVSVVNTGRFGDFVYLDVYLPKDGPLNAGYEVAVRTTKPVVSVRARSSQLSTRPARRAGPAAFAP